MQFGKCRRKIIVYLFAMQFFIKMIFFYYVIYYVIISSFILFEQYAHF